MWRWSTASRESTSIPAFRSTGKKFIPREPRRSEVPEPPAVKGDTTTPPDEAEEVERLDALLSYYQPILDRLQLRISTIKSQNTGLVAVEVAVLSVLLATIFALSQLGLKLGLITISVVVGCVGLYLISLVLALSLFGPTKYRELEWGDSDHEVLVTLPRRELMAHHLFNIREALKGNSRVHDNQVRYHELAFRIFMVANALLLILAASRPQRGSRR